MRCDICKGDAVIQGGYRYRYKESGLDNVYLDNIEVLVCNQCGEESPFIPRILDLHAVIAREVVLQPAPLRGQDVRFLRKQLGMRAKEWAGLLRVDAATLSRWENGDQQIGSQSDLLFRFLFVRISEEREGRLFPGKVAEQIAATRPQQAGTPLLLVDVNTMAASWHPSPEEMLINYEESTAQPHEAVPEAGDVLQGQLTPGGGRIVSGNVDGPAASRRPSSAGNVMIKAA